MKRGGTVTGEWVLIVLEWETIEREGAQRIIDWLENCDAAGYWQCVGQCWKDDTHGLVFGFSDASVALFFMMRWRGK